MATRIVIIGGGPAGYEAALVAAARGPEVAEVTVVDSDGIGGACVLWDCVPSKTFIASTGVRTELRRAPDLGYALEFEDAKIELPKINERVKTLAAAQSADIAERLRSEGVTLIAGRGELVDNVPGMAAHTVKVTAHDGATGTIKADVVLIATGARPRVLPGAETDGERILNWRQLYDLDKLPEHLVVVGSGVTGAEFVNAYTELGVKVTVVASRDQILPHEDSDAAAVLEDALASRGVTLVKNARAESVVRSGDGVLVTMTDGRTVEGSHALMTVGSVPNTSGTGARSGRHRARAGRLSQGRPGVAHVGAGHLRRGRLHRLDAAGLGGRHAGPYRDVSRAWRGPRADPAAHGGRRGVHPAGDCGCGGAAVEDRRRRGGRPYGHAAAEHQRAEPRCRACGAAS